MWLYAMEILMNVGRIHDIYEYDLQMKWYRSNAMKIKVCDPSLCGQGPPCEEMYEKPCIYTLYVSWIISW